MHRRLFDDDTAIKILSIILAVLMWLYVMNEQNPQVTYIIKDVPVKLVNLDEEKLVLKDESAEFKVNVKVRGRRSLVSDLKSDDISAEMNMKGRIEGENLIRVDVVVPPNIELIDVYPREILVTLEAVIEEERPVTVEVTGTTAQGFAARPAQVSPQYVTVKGPRSAVEAVNKVVVYIDVSGKDKPIIGNFPFKVLDKNGKEQKRITFTPQTVEVTVPIVPVANTQIIPNIKGNPPEGYIIRDVRIDPPSIIVTGSEEELANVQSITTEPIDIQDRTSTTTFDVDLIFPNGITSFDEDVRTAKVTVEIEKLSETTLNLNSDNVTIEGIASGLSASVEQTQLILTVSGPNSIIDKVNENMVKLKIDLTGLTAGEHTVKVQGDISRPYRIIKIEPSDIHVVISEISQ